MTDFVLVGVLAGVKFAGCGSASVVDVRVTLVFCPADRCPHHGVTQADRRLHFPRTLLRLLKVWLRVADAADAASLAVDACATCGALYGVTRDACLLLFWLWC